MSELEQSLLRALKKAVQQRDCLVHMLAGIDKAQLLEMLGVEDFNRCMDILKECEE
jgi:uncharacterized protein YutE (UPF0331/DUF86 family)